MQHYNINEYIVTQCIFKQRWTFADHRIQSVTQNIIFHISPPNIACYRLPISRTTTEFPAFVLRALLQGQVISEWVELRTEHFVETPSCFSQGTLHDWILVLFRHQVVFHRVHFRTEYLFCLNTKSRKRYSSGLNICSKTKSSRQK